ncbi:hypothetical protein [Brevibacterium renqingii]|uniref:hypothetical protein n=1 Tax=Brevibacterium renqingii TaxID=2776916 RepID=UPI001AE0B043|nr:hypothetical protein [Brevibacterium renqingii]
MAEIGTQATGHQVVNETGAADRGPDGDDRRLFALDVMAGQLVAIDRGSGELAVISNGLTDAPDGVAVDIETARAFVTQMGQPDRAARSGQEPPFEQANGSLVSVDLITGETKEIVGGGAFVTGKQLIRKPADGQLFWADREGCAIYRCEHDGSNVTPLILTAGQGPTEAEEQCVGVAVDPLGGHLYWTQKGPSKAGKGRILRAGLEIPEGESAASRTDVETIFSGLPEPIDLELDSDEGVLYWTDRGAGPQGNSLNRALMPAPGRSAGAPTVLAADFREAIGLALDLARGRAYVSDLSGDIHEVDLRRGTSRVLSTLEGAATGIALA